MFTWYLLLFIFIKENSNPVKSQYPIGQAELGNEDNAVFEEGEEKSPSDDATQNPISAGPEEDIGGNAQQKRLSLTVKDSGIMDLHRGDTALIFYITTLNAGHEVVHLSVEGRKCCQQITPTDEDCESITLIGGDMGELAPGDTRNLTLFYPNMYLHDRVGFCDIDIISDAHGVMHFKLSFDTTLPRKGHIPPLLQNYYSSSELSTCRSVDENPLNDCLPAYCHMKYNGYRNFFNHTSRRCEKIPECVSDQESDIPEIVYVPVSNKCRKLRDHLTEEDLTWFEESEKAETLDHLHSYPMNVRCNRGRRNPENGWCECEPGWASAAFDHATFNPDTMVYHMCTIWTGSGNAPEAEGIEAITEKLPSALVIGLSISTALLALMVVIFIIYNYIQRRKHKKLNKEGNFSNESDEGLLRD